ncbi:MAG: SRPBCC family protein [Bryobacterales bacterium]|nr:SRPBCC family protein [Bryobacterales bacterium]
MLKKILLVILAIVVMFVVVVSLRPSSYAVQRTAVVPAPPETVFALVNDFRHWEKWSPWAKLDPNMKESHSGVDSGKGAVYDWEGNSDVGKGRMTIQESHPNEHISIYLEFLEPFASVSDTDFRFKPAAGGTEVTWAMKGEMGFMEKAFGLFMDMDAMIGKDFEKGLAQMTDAVKTMPAPAPVDVPAAPATP